MDGCQRDASSTCRTPIKDGIWNLVRWRFFSTIRCHTIGKTRCPVIAFVFPDGHNVFLLVQVDRTIWLIVIALHHKPGAGEVSAVPVEVVDVMTSVEEPPVAAQATATFAQCKSSSYMRGCHLGVPCDCSQGSSASGQFEEASYAFLLGCEEQCRRATSCSSGNGSSCAVQVEFQKVLLRLWCPMRLQPGVNCRTCCRTFPVVEWAGRISAANHPGTFRPHICWSRQMCLQSQLDG